MTKHPHCVYLLVPTSGKHRLAVGYTNDPAKRLAVHNDGKVKGTSPWKPYRMLVVERFPTRSTALSFEKYLKLHPTQKRNIMAHVPKLNKDVTVLRNAKLLRPNANQKWTKAEEQQLRDEFHLFVERSAQKYGRPVKGITGRLEKIIQ